MAFPKHRRRLPPGRMPRAPEAWLAAHDIERLIAEQADHDEARAEAEFAALLAEPEPD